jgi:ABC transporter DrrB family efflux protein
VTLTATTRMSGLTGLRWTVADAMTIGRRNLLRYLRLPQLLVFSTVQPVMFILLFNYVFGGAIRGIQAPKYIDFLVPGILAQTVLFGTVNTGIGLAEDLKGGMIDRYRSLPMARSAVIAGRILADTVRNAFVVLLMLLVGTLIGFRFQGDAIGALGTVLLAVLFGLPFSWISAWIGLTLRDPETVQVAGFVWLFPLFFISSAFVPVETMPSWLQQVARVNPFTLTVNALRDMSLGYPAGHDLVRSLAWIAALTLIASTLAIRRYRS